MQVRFLPGAPGRKGVGLGVSANLTGITGMTGLAEPGRTADSGGKVLPRPPLPVGPRDTPVDLRSRRSLALEQRRGFGAERLVGAARRRAAVDGETPQPAALSVSARPHVKQVATVVVVKAHAEHRLALAGCM
jgi:hypothetical protein